MPSIDATVDQFRSFYASCMAAAARQPAWPPGYAWQTRLEGAFEAVPRECSFHLALGTLKLRQVAM